MEKIEKLIDKLEDNIRWWKRAIETDGFESDEEGSYRRDLENTKKELFNLISQELDKAREEGTFTREESKILRWSVENSEEAICTIWDKDILEVIQSKLSKLKTKEDGK